MIMKFALWLAASLFSIQLQALEYEVQFKNDLVQVAKVKVMPYEEIGLHRDTYPQVVVALKGGTITRLESNGSTTEVEFPTGVAVFREVDPPEEFHRSVNKSSEPVELLVIQLLN